MREAAKFEYGDIVCLGMAGGKKLQFEGRGYRGGRSVSGGSGGHVRTAFQFMPDSLRLV